MVVDVKDREAVFNFIVREGNGVKGLMDLGSVTEVPDHYIQPPEKRIDGESVKKSINGSATPVIDLSKLEGPARDQVVEEIAGAAETIGFFQVVNHGVPLELLESVKQASREFHGQPVEKKSLFLPKLSPSHLVRYGTSVADPEKEKVLEWKDYINLKYISDDEARQYWPNQWKEILLEYLRAATKLKRTLVEVLLARVGVILDDSKIDALLKEKEIYLHFYPKCPCPELTIAAGCHSDVGILTVLLQDEVGGLQVNVVDETGKAAWMEIPPVPGALIVNIGDVLQILSNGRYKSAEHRVQSPEKSSRVSIPFFSYPKRSEKVGPLMVEEGGLPRYRELSYGDYVDNYCTNFFQGKKPIDFARTDLDPFVA